MLILSPVLKIVQGDFCVEFYLCTFTKLLKFVEFRPFEFHKKYSTNLQMSQKCYPYSYDSFHAIVLAKLASWNIKIANIKKILKTEI